MTSDEKTTRATAFPPVRLARGRIRLGAAEWIVDGTRPQLSIGRGEENDVVVDNHYASRLHASVQHRNGKLYLADTSMNGTYLLRGTEALYLHEEVTRLDGVGVLELGRRETTGLEFAVETRASEGEAWRAAEIDAAKQPVIAERPAHQVADYVFRREGEYWTIGYGGTLFRVRDAKGLRFIAQLLRYPDREFHALDLALEGLVAGGLARGSASAHGLEVHAESGAGPQLDGQAKAAYRRRLAELREELTEAELLNDTGMTERVREELAFLSDQLSTAVGLGGRDREVGSHTERARVLVTIRIRSMIKKLQQCDPSLGHHLATTIKTGRFCSYTPDPKHPVRWDC